MMTPSYASPEGLSEGKDDNAIVDDKPKANWRSLFNFTSPNHVPIITLAVAFALAVALVMPCLSIILGKDFDMLE